MTILRASTAALLRAEMDTLGDEIVYTPGGGSASTFNAWVDFGSDTIYSGGSAATASTPVVEMSFEDVPYADKPTNAARVVIAIRPGLTWAITDAKEGPTGESWICTLKKAPA